MVKELLRKNNGSDSSLKMKLEDADACGSVFARES